MFCVKEITGSHLLVKAPLCPLRLSGAPATHRASAHAILSSSGLSGVRWSSKTQHQRSNVGAIRLTNTQVGKVSEMEAMSSRTVC